MEHHPISQTIFDQMITTEQSQMMKALIPYLPAAAQSFFSVYTKTCELSNTLRMFSSTSNMQMSAQEISEHSPTEVLQDIQKYCYGETQQKLKQINNFFVLMEMFSVMNQM